MSAQAKHHPYGPSSLSRVFACYGSAVLCESAQEDESEDANEGTMLHAVLAGTPQSAPLSAEQAEAVAFCREQLQRFGDCQWLYEAPLSLVDESFNEVSFGTADAVLVREEDIIVIDWKFGRVPVAQAWQNLQMSAYAAMAMQTFDRPKALAVVVQPRIKRVTDGVFGPEVIDILVKKIHEIADENAAGLRLRYSEDACRYCRAYRTCPEYSRHATALTATSPHAVTDPNTLAQYLDAAAQAKKWADSVRHRAQQMMVEEKLTVPGWTLVTKRGTRTVKNPQDIYERIVPTIGHQRFMDAVTLSLTSLEDAYATKRKEDAGVTLKAAKEEFQAAIADFIEREPDRQEIRKKGAKE